MAADLFTNLVMQFGLLGLFIAAIIANLTLFFPLPIDIVVFFVGSVDFLGIGIMGPLVIGLVVGLGAGIGELSGYIIGLAGIKGVEVLKKKQFEQVDLIKERIKNRGMIFILLAALTPFPFDIVGIIAGLIKYDLKRFYVACALGKIIRNVILAYAGYFGIGLVKGLLGIP